MNRTERLYRIEKLLREHHIVPRTRFLNELEISLATFKRDLAYLRDRLNAPIEYDADAGGYQFGKAIPGASHELPGMWFDAREIHALLTMQQLLQELQPGLLTPHIKPLLDRLRQLLESAHVPENEVRKRIRVLRVNGRYVQSKAFDPISSALLSRHQIKIHYFHRGRNAAESRTVSPQRLTYYRDNWYLDAWCHTREAIRSFSLDAIEHAEIVDLPAIDVAEVELDAVFQAGYGIFSGKTVEWAVLRFTPERARWVSRELWHPQQQSEFEADGHYILRLPYSDDRELVMDILRHMPEVVVLEPVSLRVQVKTQLEKGMSLIK